VKVQAGVGTQAGLPADRCSFVLRRLPVEIDQAQFEGVGKADVVKLLTLDSAAASSAGDDGEGDRELEVEVWVVVDRLEFVSA
jgi:hypothetical protein